MLFWNLFIQTAAIIVAVMLIGAGLSAMARKNAKAASAEGGNDGA
ncbi:hypothetical protein [uncultured Cohaesibacter sp.]|nr:hypothetical protein [uncultured Cohaesibacter sp.]